MVPSLPPSAMGILLGAALLLLTPGSATVFDATVLQSTFGTLDSRQCLPNAFNTSSNRPAAPYCAGNVSMMLASGGLPTECVGAPKLALFYNCFANSMGKVGVNAFDIDFLENIMLTYTDDQDWNGMEQELMTACIRSSSASLTPQQQTVYSYGCTKWSLFAECDQQQDKNGTLDDAGKLRRARFLSGDCPLSPSTLLDAFGKVTNRTWADCSHDYSGNDATLLYEAAVEQTACLLQDFEGNGGNVTFPALVQAITNANAGDLSVSSGLLIQTVEKCAGKKQGGVNEYEDMTLEEFVKCWAGHGVFSCAKQEANQVASGFPEACVLTVDISS